MTHMLEDCSSPCVIGQRDQVAPSMWEKSAFHFLHSAVLCRSPDGKAERDLVHEVSKVVHQIESAVLHSTHQISKEVTKGVDRPADCDDETHGAERGLYVLVHLIARGTHGTSFTQEDLEQDETPSTHADNETHHRRYETSLTRITGSQHDDGTNQQTPEHHLANVALHRREDQVELDHLQRHSDRPIDVTIEDWGSVEGDPELAHVEVMHCCNQGSQSTDVHGCLPMVCHIHRFHQEEHSRSHH